MVDFIVTMIFMVSLTAVLVLVVRALPRIAHEEQMKTIAVWDRFLASGIIERVDIAANTFFMKFLRKAKVSILKIDNSITVHLRKVSSLRAPERAGLDVQELSEARVEIEKE